MTKLFASTFLLAVVLPAADPADWIVTAKWVVTMDAQHRVIEDGAVAVVGSNIAAVGPRAEIEARFTAPCELAFADAIGSGQDISMRQTPALKRPFEQRSLFFVAFQGLPG